jgi:hypothetical protein
MLFEGDLVESPDGGELTPQHHVNAHQHAIEDVAALGLSNENLQEKIIKHARIARKEDNQGKNTYRQTASRCLLA